MILLSILLAFFVLLLMFIVFAVTGGALTLFVVLAEPIMLVLGIVGLVKFIKWVKKK